MASPLIEAVQRRGGSEPHDPWLFWPRGLDWSFLTWGQAARRLDALGTDLTAASGWQVAFPWSGRGEDWLFDLGLHLAGAVAVPVTATAGACLVGAARARRAAVICEVGRPCFARSVRRRSLDGGWLICGRGGIERWDDARVTDGVDRLARGLGPATAGRDIALLHGGPEEGAVRTVLSWSTLHGAAVVLEPNRDGLLETFRWARPTVLLASAATVAELQRRIEATWRERFGGWRRRRICGRLRALVLTDEGAVATVERQLWNATGVHVVSI